MNRPLAVFTLFASALLFATGGCSKPAETPPAEEVTVDAHGHSHDQGEIDKAIAELPEAERAVATAQKICPVSEEPLGTMGMPYKVTVKERDVYLCCEGCKKQITSDPDKYLAKLPQK